MLPPGPHAQRGHRTGVRERYSNLAFLRAARSRSDLRVLAALPALSGTPAKNADRSRMHGLWAAQPAAPGRRSGRRDGRCTDVGRGVHGLTHGCTHLPKHLATAHVWAVIGLSQPELQSEADLVLARLERHPGPWLDLACGPGALAARMLARAPDRVVVASDLSPAMLSQTAARSQAFRVRANALNLPFADAAFGAVVNLAALDLYANPQLALTECLRVLAPGGAWLGSCFVWPERWLRWSRTRLLAPLFRQSGTLALTPDSLHHLLRRTGFTQIESQAFGAYNLVWAEKPSRLPAS